MRKHYPGLASQCLIKYTKGDSSVTELPFPSGTADPDKMDSLIGDGDADY